MGLFDSLLGGKQGGGKEPKSFPRNPSPSPPRPPKSSSGPGLPSDPYAERLQAALTKINRPDYPEGMIPWLREAHSILHLELTEGLPNEMQRLWSGHAPLEDFDRILELWVEAHQTACELFNAARASNQARHVTEKHRR